MSVFMDKKKASDERITFVVNNIEWKQYDQFNEAGQLIARGISMKDDRGLVDFDSKESRRAFWTYVHIEAVREEKRVIAETVIDPRADLRAAGMSDMAIAAFEAKHDIDLSPKIEKEFETVVMYEVDYRHGDRPDGRRSGERSLEKVMTLEDAMAYVEKFTKRYSTGRKAA